MFKPINVRSFGPRGNNVNVRLFAYNNKIWPTLRIFISEFILCVSMLVSAALIQSHIHLLAYVTHIISSLSSFYQLSLNTMYIIKDRQKAIIY